MDLDHITYLGATDSRGQQKPFGIRSIDRSKHMYIIGKTGMGKSTLLENMAIQDIQHGEGIGFIDPHGSTAEKLLDYVPEHRIQDVIYFAPFDMDHPVAFNVMEDVGYDKRHLVVSGLMSAFNKIWQDAWSARMEYILTNTLLALLEYPNSTLLDVIPMLINKPFRKKVVDYISDPLVKSFWVEEFANYTDRYTQEATPAIQNKIGQFTSNPLIRNIVGQPKSTFDMREVMDTKKIFIANLSKGRMGETNADLIGSMLTTKIYLSAMSRADEKAAVQAKLPAFYFYVDEFQSIANDSFADILSEARKYKLALIIAHQYIEQMEENVRNAVFGNVGTTIAFRVGPFDAEVLETVFQPKFMAEDLVNLAFAQIYLTLMIDGVGSPPFSATTLPPIEVPEITFTDEIIKQSRATYGRSRDHIEDAIKQRGSAEDAKSNGASSSTPKNSSKKAPQFKPKEEKKSAGKSENKETKPTQQPQKQDTSPNSSHSGKNNRPTMSLNQLKKPQDGKGPSKEQLSALREALSSALKTPPQSEEKTKAKEKVEEKREESSEESTLPKEMNQKKDTPAQPNGQKDVEQPSREVPKEVLENILKGENPKN